MCKKSAVIIVLLLGHCISTIAQPAANISNKKLTYELCKWYTREGLPVNLAPMASLWANRVRTAGIDAGAGRR